MDPAIKWSHENDEDEAASMSRRQGDVQTILVSFFKMMDEVNEVDNVESANNTWLQTCFDEGVVTTFCVLKKGWRRGFKLLSKNRIRRESSFLTAFSQNNGSFSWMVHEENERDNWVDWWRQTPCLFSVFGRIEKESLSDMMSLGYTLTDFQRQVKYQRSILSLEVKKRRQRLWETWSQGGFKREFWATPKSWEWKVTKTMSSTRTVLLEEKGMMIRLEQ